MTVTMAFSKAWYVMMSRGLMSALSSSRMYLQRRRQQRAVTCEAAGACVLCECVMP
jgi:hypothetical protein